MAVFGLKLENLKHLDNGKIPVAWQQAIERAIHDCEDRPEETKARKVTLQATLVPLQEQGSLDSVNVEFQIKDTIPQRNSKMYNMGVRRIKGNQKCLVFNDLSDDNVHQRTIDDDEEDQE